MNNENLPYGVYINHLSKKFKCSFKEKCNEKGINATYAEIIKCIVRSNNRVYQNDIAENTHLKAPTVSLTLKNMELLGLITRETDEEDSRKVLVKLTDKGYEMDNIIKECYKELDCKMVNNISIEDLGNLKRIILQMTENLGGKNV